MSPSFNFTDTNLQQTLHNHLPYSTRYGTPFIYHALLAAMVWAVLVPVSHLVINIVPKTKSSIHPITMIAAALLTYLSYVIGFRNSTATPTQHSLLANAVFFALSLQLVGGMYQPKPHHRPWRRNWLLFHHVFGTFVFILSYFVLVHSLSVFDVDGWLLVVIFVMLVIGACASVVECIFTILTIRKNRQVQQKDRSEGQPLLDNHADGDV